MSYSNDQFTVNSAGTGVMASRLTSDSFYCGKLKENLSILLFMILITNSSENVLYKYTLEPVYIDSSDLISLVQLMRHM